MWPGGVAVYGPEGLFAGLLYQSMMAEKAVGHSKWILSHVPPLSVLHVILVTLPIHRLAFCER